MSEAVRSYSNSGRVGFDAPSSRGGWLRRIILVFLAIGLIWMYWTTRDTYPIERLVPRDQTFHLQAEHLLSSRLKAASSPLWNLGLLPEQYKTIPGWLGNDFGQPDWVLNNLVSDVCYVSGKDFNTFSDLLVVTRMSRIGCLIERYHRFVDVIEDEYAGGLQLRRMANTDTYYAVRGRTLVFSPSREALIAALSQRKEDSVESLEDAVSATGGDVQGRIVLPETDPLGKYFERADFVLTFSPSSIAFACRGKVRTAWRDALDALTTGAGSRGLVVPNEGAFVLAGDFGAPMPDVYRLLDEISTGSLSAYVQALPVLKHVPPAESALWSSLAEAILQDMGASFALRWTGFDVDGAVPLPLLELILKSSNAGIQDILLATPVLAAGERPAAGLPYRDPDTATVHCPIGWGGIVEPVVESSGTGLRIALHPEHLNALGPITRGTNSSQETGQLFLRIRPTEALALIREGGLPYARAGLLRGQTEESFLAVMNSARDGIQQFEEARLTASYEAGALSIEAVIDLGGAPVEEEE